MSKKDHKRALITGIGVGVLVLAGIGWWALRPAEVPPEPPKAQQRPRAIAPEIETKESDAEFLGRVPVADFARNEKGALMLGPQFLEIFDAFRARFLGLGEQAMYEAFGEWVRGKYSTDEARYLTDVFKKYITYLKVLGEPGVLKPGMGLEERYRAMKVVREGIFGKELSDLLFSALDRRIGVASRLDAISRDTSLSGEGRRAALEAFKNSLDGTTRKEFFPTNPNLQYREGLQELRANEDLNEDELAARTRALREEKFGAEAADRLEELDAERAARAERVGNYWRAAEAVEFDESLTDEERATRLDALKEQYLTEEDVRRIEARDAAEQLEKMDVSDVAGEIRRGQEGESEPLDWDTPAQRGENIGVQDGGEPSSP